ncbi:MAG: HAD family hydrolase [Gammaproteobacteria bacterium]|nr:HAD family hydrolase [Gammaproteobacteria bacterium]
MKELHCDAVVFDFDGVLVESVDVKTQAFAALYAPYGSQIVDQVVAWHLAHGGVSRYEKFRHFHQTFLHKPLPAHEEAELAQRFSDLVEDAVVAAPWVGGAQELLETLHVRVPLFVASGTPEEELIRIIARRNMTRFFAGVAGAPRKKGEIIRGFIQSYEIAASRTLMVGDAMTDYSGAIDAGVMFVGIACGTHGFPKEVQVLSDLVELIHMIIAPQRPPIEIMH